MAESNDCDDWRSKCKNVAEMQALARKRALFIDVRFLVGRSKSARYFSAHKMMLACGSPVFEAMFFGQLAEKKDPIVIPDDDPEAFEVMLRYLYGECVSFQSIVVACKTYCIGDKYLILQLQSMSSDYISSAEMDDENFWGIIEGNLLSVPYAEEKFHSYMKQNATRLLKSEEFLDAPEDIVKAVLQMNELNATEFELLSSVTKWGLKRFTDDTVSKLRTLLKNIRFCTLTPKEFCLFTDHFPEVLEPQICMKILKHLIDETKYNLPYWCSTNKVTRNPALGALDCESNQCVSLLAPEQDLRNRPMFNFNRLT